MDSSSNGQKEGIQPSPPQDDSEGKQGVDLADDGGPCNANSPVPRAKQKCSQDVHQGGGEVHDVELVVQLARLN